MAKKTNPEEDRIFKPPESPHFQTAADNGVAKISKLPVDAGTMTVEPATVWLAPPPRVRATP
jgi:hypothetical protein